MEIDKPTISAKNIEEFKKYEDLLNLLPKNIVVQFSSVKMGIVGLECTFRQKYDNEIKILIPRDLVTQISDFGEYIGIYCDKYFLKIEGNMKKEKITYVFVDSINKK